MVPSQSIRSVRSPVLSNVAAIVALLTTLFGAFAMLDPRTALKTGFSNEPPVTLEAQTLTDSLMRVFGARDMFLGLAVLGAWYNDDRKSLAWLCLLGTGVTMVDGLEQRKMGGGSPWSHWAATIIMGTLAIGL